VTLELAIDTNNVYTNVLIQLGVGICQTSIFQMTTKQKFMRYAAGARARIIQRSLRLVGLQKWLVKSYLSVSDVWQTVVPSVP
jgi:hypothetical protein